MCLPCLFEVGCTRWELKKAYRRALLRKHPDKAVGITSEEANARFQAAIEAYEVLGRSTQEARALVEWRRLRRRKSGFGEQRAPHGRHGRRRSRWFGEETRVRCGGDGP